MSSEGVRCQDDQRIPADGIASRNGIGRHLAAVRTRDHHTETGAVAFGVHFEGRVVGSQDLSAHDFTDRRTVNTGSWLTQRVHGKGLGTEMRAALLLFAFDVLGAEWAESGAASWNEASLNVSKKLGYELNGITRVAPRKGEPVDEQRVRLEKAAFVRPDWSIAVSGVEPALAQLGVKR